MFAAHGKYTLDLTGEVIIVQFYDTWNKECSIQFLNDYTKYVLGKCPGRFGVLADLTTLKGATPESVSYFHKISEWGQQNGQIARAQLIDTEFKLFTIQTLQKGNDHYPIASFTDKISALVWLKEQELKIE